MVKTRRVESGNDVGSQLRVQRRTKQAFFAGLAMLVMQPALAGPIDLRLFYADPSDFVKTGSTDGTAAGSFATMTEDLSTGALLLSNDPGLGDPTLIDPTEGSTLRFQYAFNADCPVSCDNLVATLFETDPTTGAGGPLFGFFKDVVVDSSGTGEISFLLSDFVLDVNQVFGLEIEMLAFDDSAGASARISGLEVYDPAAAATVPEPTSLALLLSGLIALMVRRRATST